MHPLDGCNEKLKRAREQVQALESDVDTWLAKNPYSVVDDRKTDPAKYFMRMGPAKEREPLMWSVIAGEIIHDIRSTLDHLVCQCVRVFNPLHDCDRLQFPIVDDPAEFSCQKWKTKGVGPKAQAFIESVQPYHGPEPLSQHPFSLLRDLSNTDKHRILNLTGAIVSGGAYFIPSRDSVDLLLNQLAVNAQGVFEEGAVILESTIGSDPLMNMGFQPSFGVGFGKGSPADGQMFPSLLTIIEYRVRTGVIEPATALF